MSHKKAGGSTALGRDSVAKRLGVKLYAGQVARPGMVLVRQRGAKFRAGAGVKRGGDDTLYSLVAGTVKFYQRKLRGYDGKLKLKNFVSVVAGKK